MSDLHRSSLKQGAPTREQIEVRAYEIYENRGRQHGRDIEDWLAAENELRKQRPASKSSVDTPSSVDRARPSQPTSRQRQSKTRTASPAPFENSNPADHQTSSTEF
jgi:hypothetical protein